MESLRLINELQLCTLDYNLPERGQHRVPNSVYIRNKRWRAWMFQGVLYA